MVEQRQAGRRGGSWEGSAPPAPRLVAIGVLLAALPAAIVLPPLAGLAGLVLILAAPVSFETTRYGPHPPQPPQPLTRR